MTDYSHDPPMQALLARIAAAAAAAQNRSAPTPRTSQGSPFLRWDVPRRAMGHGLYGR